MLNLNCIICAELFVGSDDVHVTTCGHMFHFACLKQWMERSKSCPQCRNRCTDRNIFRIYFNLANLDVSHIDVGSLQEQLDNANLQIKIKENELNKATQEIKKLKDIQKMSAKTISGLELKIQKNKFIMLSYVEQLEILKTEAKMTNGLRNEVETLKQQIANMESVSSVMTASTAEVEKLLKNENDPRRLCTWVATLKRELRICENRKTDLRKAFKLIQDNLRQETAAKRLLEERISQLESENYQLQEKLKTLEASNNTERIHNDDDKTLNNTTASVSQATKRLTISPTIKENIKKIEESNSPYLNIKSSSIGLMPLFKRNPESTKALMNHTTNSTTKLAILKVSPKKQDASNSSNNKGALRKTSSDITEKYSILKKPRLNIAAVRGVEPQKSLSANYVFNGLGGSERIDPFIISDDDDGNEVTSHKLPSTSTTSTVPKSNGASLNNRLKAGGLRNFNVTK